MTHALASTTLTDFPSVSGHFTHCWDFLLCTSCQQFNCCGCTKLIQFLACTRIPCRHSHCENGLVRCCLYTNSIHVPVVINIILQQYIQWCMSISGNVKKFSGKGNDSSFGMYSSTTGSTRWRYMKIPDLTWNHFWLPNHPVLRHLGVWLEKRVRLILLEELLVLLLCLGCPGLRWTLSDPDILKEFWLFHLRLGKWNYHLSLALTLPLHWAFGRGFQIRPSAPILQCLR